MNNWKTNPEFNLNPFDHKACSRHKPEKLGYLQWFDWVEKKAKQGAKQNQCKKCGKWYFNCEY